MAALRREVDRELDRLIAAHEAEGLSPVAAIAKAHAELPQSEAYETWHLADRDLTAYRDRYQDQDACPWRLERRFPSSMEPTDPASLPDPTADQLLAETHLIFDERFWVVMEPFLEPSHLVSSYNIEQHPMFGEAVEIAHQAVMDSVAFQMWLQTPDAESERPRARTPIAGTACSTQSVYCEPDRGP